jgi:hypothetical protein
MIYLLVHLGSKFPAHIKDCLHQIYKKDKNCQIYLIGNIKPDFIEQDFIFVNVEDLDVPRESYFSNNNNPLWHNSLMRVFAINSFMQKNNIEGIIHFDNDVMIYSDFTELKHLFENKNYITPHKTTEYTFGFSYLNNKQEFNILCERILKLIGLGEFNVKNLTGDEAHEMRLLGFCGSNIIKDLPTHPQINNVQEFIFDPSSYGQFVGGTPNGHLPGFIDKTQLGGSLFTEPPNIRYNKEEDIFYYIYNNTEYKIFNLHVHNKDLKNINTYLLNKDET